jgi:hypothetical protein
VKTYAVLHTTASGVTRREEITADRFDVEFGVLVFFDTSGIKRAAFRDWLRIDRLT